jgi:4-diphosphocytidyl-2-C-methyl-D-erythritol kinase
MNEQGSWTLRTHAKINLGLKVLGKRDDGFHELITLMHEIDLHDCLEVRASEKDELKISGINLAVEEDNLLFKVMEKLRGRGHQIGSLALNLHKRIPIGGGLGGGSSNAIGLLNLLGDQLGLADVELDEIAAELGSDTNFFLKGGSSICHGRGEKVEMLPDQNWFFNLLLPKVSCSTPVVFSKYKHREGLSEVDFEHCWREGSNFGHNDLLEPCCRAYPMMERLFGQAEEKTISLFLSGSGSTCFTLHSTREERDQVKEKIKSWGPDVNLIGAQSYRRGLA